MKYFCIICVLLMLSMPAVVWGGVKSKAMKESAEYVMKKFGREATEQFGEDATLVMARQMETLAAKYGDDIVITASKKVGPRMFRLVEEVGEDGKLRALKLMARNGDDAVWVVSRPKSFSLFAKYGDDAADAMIRHHEIAETLIENYGTPIARALASVNGQNGRRLAMLANDGVLAKIPQPEGVFNAIGKYGDKGADWVWRNKGAITTASVAVAFVRNPEPFINGAVEVVDIGGEKVIRPVVEAAAKSLNWNLIIGVPVVVLMLWFIGKRVWIANLKIAASKTNSVGTRKR